MRRYFIALLAGLCGLCLLNCIVVPPPDTNDPVQTIVDDANFPVAMAIAPDGRIFYTEKNGRIRVISADLQLLPDPFATVPVNTISERGLLGIALHPDFANNGFVYVFYTRGGLINADDNRVVRFTAAGNVAGGDETLIFTLLVAPGPNHNGGNIHFGRDGKLYITLGELAERSNSQRIDNVPGKILRINDDGSIPNDNPFGAGNAIFALGLRNSFDFAFDPVSGVIFATENGASHDDEINRIVAGGNYGWPNIEGPADTPEELSFSPQFGTLIGPVVQLFDIVVPTGIDFAPDATFGAAVRHQMFVGEYHTGRVMRYSLNANRTALAGETTFIDDIPGGITDIAFAADGTLFISTSTKILRVVPVE